MKINHVSHSSWRYYFQGAIAMCRLMRVINNGIILNYKL